MESRMILEHVDEDCFTLLLWQGEVVLGRWLVETAPELGIMLEEGHAKSLPSDGIQQGCWVPNRKHLENTRSDHSEFTNVAVDNWFFYTRCQNRCQNDVHKIWYATQALEYIMVPEGYSKQPSPRTMVHETSINNIDRLWHHVKTDHHVKLIICFPHKTKGSNFANKTQLK